MVQFRHVDGQMVSVKYVPLAPRIMPRRFLVFRPVDNPDDLARPWLIEPESDKVRHLMQNCIFRKYDNGNTAVCSIDDVEAVVCLLNYQKFYPESEQSQETPQANYYEPE